MKKTLIAIAVVAALGAAACDTSSTDTTLPGLADSTTSSVATGDSVAGTIAAVQAQMDALAQDIQNSEASDDLQAAWADLQADVESATEALQSGSSYDAAALQSSIDEFGDALAALGSETAPELQSAWSQLRAVLDSLVS